jgi:HTH-type transcriptional regulator/antitoxin HigA
MENIRAIRTEKDYDWALQEIEQYFVHEPAKGTPAAERFDVLASLIEAYEAKRWPIEPADPIDAIQYRMEISGFTQRDLAAVLGSRSRASEILNRRRLLTRDMAYRLNREWNIPADVLLKPYRLRAA